jgi:hypothetical protein
LGIEYITSNTYSLAVYQVYIRVKYTLTGGNYLNIDETSPDDLDYLYASPSVSGTTNAEIVSADHFSLSSAATDLSATVAIRGRCHSSTGVQIGAVIKIANTNYFSPSSQALTTIPTTYSFTWNANPATNSSWTPADLNGTSASAMSAYGFYIYNTSSAASTAIITQCSISVDGDVTPSTMGILLRKGGTVIASATREMAMPGVETDEQIKISDMVYLTAGQTLDVQARKTATNDVIMSGSDFTYVAIHRLGSQAL